MRCDQFDTYIDEMLSGILHPEAARHRRECERCGANYARRAALQANLRQLAASATAGPSVATDRAVLEAFRRRQHHTAQPPVTAPVLHFPRRAAISTRAWWSGLAAAALLVASIASGVHLWRGTGVVTAPQRAAGPMSVPRGDAPVAPTEHARMAGAVAQHRPPSHLEHSSVQMASLEAPASETPTRLAASQRQSVAYDGGNYEPAVARTPAAQPVLRLASMGSGNMAGSASSTWQGYSNLMYCDPVTCAGPMQVVRIKVPVGQVKANLGQTSGEGYVNADVVVGPDGLARAIRMAD